MPDGEIDSCISHLSDVHDRRSSNTGGSRRLGVEEKIVRCAAINAHHKIASPAEENHVRTDVRRPVLFPLEIRISERGLTITRDDSRVRSSYVVVRVAAVTAEH